MLGPSIGGGKLRSLCCNILAHVMPVHVRNSKFEALLFRQITKHMRLWFHSPPLAIITDRECFFGESRVEHTKPLASICIARLRLNGTVVKTTQSSNRAEMRCTIAIVCADAVLVCTRLASFTPKATHPLVFALLAFYVGGVASVLIVVRVKFSNAVCARIVL